MLSFFTIHLSGVKDYAIYIFLLFESVIKIKIRIILKLGTSEILTMISISSLIVIQFNYNAFTSNTNGLGVTNFSAACVVAWGVEFWMRALGDIHRQSWMPWLPLVPSRRLLVGLPESCHSTTCIKYQLEAHISKVCLDQGLLAYRVMPTNPRASGSETIQFNFDLTIVTSGSDVSRSA